MDHSQAVREKATERYLLNELDPESRDRFEEHLFDCPECAIDVRTAAMFVEQTKVVLKETPVAIPVRVPAVAPTPALSGWFAWMRPAFAVPVFALLLLAIGYQGVINSRLERANSPQVLATAVINVGVRGDTAMQVPAHVGQPFQLTLNIPPGSYSSYKLDLYAAKGELEWSRTVPAAGGDAVSLYIPGSDHEPGALAVHGMSASGESVDLGKYQIEFQK